MMPRNNLPTDGVRMSPSFASWRAARNASPSAVSLSAISFGDLVGSSAPTLSTTALWMVRYALTRFLKSAMVAAIEFGGCPTALARTSATYIAHRTQRATQLHLFFIGASRRTSSTPGVWLGCKSAAAKGTDVAAAGEMIRRVLLGRPLRSDEQEAEQLGPARAVPVLGLDALASAAYGPEAALTVLMATGAAAAHVLGGVIAAVLAVLALVYVSYLQTLGAYPNGGGSYTVAKENLGVIAATALCTDYVLNVSVAIAAGV